MCGISGFIDRTNNTSVSVLKEMNDALAHRGPDHAQIHHVVKGDHAIGLAHRRLAIIDLNESGHQPMRFKEFTIILNGEIYNYKELKAELISLGHAFVGSSDTEVVLHAFAQWENDCVDKFIGMFAFVIYDEATNKLTCVRDRAGVKPFYYYHDAELFLFASELKAFHKHPRFKKELNYDSVAAFIQYGNVPHDACIFKNCHKLKPGHLLQFDIKKQELNIKRYWNVYDSYNQPKLDLSFEEAKSETEKLLLSAFTYRMISDVPLGIFLSGGYDSACLTALLKKAGFDSLNTYSIGVDDTQLDESVYAAKIAKHLQTTHHSIQCSENEMLDIVPQLAYQYDEPFADSSAIATMLVSKMARKDVKVALSADGGDELFAGYNRYDILLKREKLLRMFPGIALNTAAGLMDVLSSLSGKKINDRYRKLSELLKDPSTSQITKGLTCLFSDEELGNMMQKKFDLPSSPYNSTELLDEHFTPLSYMMAVDYQTYLADDILQKVDRASMTYSLEAREPFLDHRLIEFAAKLPDDFKYSNGIKKYILKEITHQYISKELMERPKMGFAVPVEKWLAGALKTKVLFYLDTERLKKQGIFNAARVQSLVNNFYAGEANLAPKIWYLLMFQMWHHQWMEKH
jgi:asparagine synthase (glutamine-hydrolysing)